MRARDPVEGLSGIDSKIADGEIPFGMGILNPHRMKRIVARADDDQTGR
jgi:hypothetical protein